MDQNQTVDNDLQKAIDDITNTTNIDPVFSDPVATPSPMEQVGPFSEEANVQMVAPAPEPIAPLQSTTDIPELNMPPIASEPTESEEPVAKEEPVVTPLSQESPEPTSESSKLNTQQIKESALRDLVPLLDHLDMNASQKFGLYRDIFEDLHDHTVLESAYKVAREIPDEKERAESLLYLVESIDKM